MNASVSAVADAAQRTTARLFVGREPRPEHSPPPRVFQPTFSGVGLVLGAIFTAASLLPSLLPRIPAVQGLATGVSFMVGYGLGAGGHAVWNYLQIPNLRGRPKLIVVAVVLVGIALNTSLAIWSWVGWQNDLRQTFGMEDLDPSAWPIVIGVALLVAVLLLAAARLLRSAARRAEALLARWLPRRLAITVAITGVVVLLWLVVSGLLVRGFFTGANAIFSVRDTQDHAGVEQTTSRLRSGGPGSLIEWEHLGRQGRNFIATAPTVEELNAWSGGGAVEPIRVYVGLRSAETLEERAELLLDELIRTRAFDREVLVLGTVTGTGFLEPNAVDSLEFLYNGDTAIAGLQYSYLPSWISLLADQDVVAEASQTSFRIVHDYWMSLPDGSRPELYLYGLSLGAFGVEAVLGSIDIINEPIDGALLAGPPFVNYLHNDLERDRDPGSPAWMPVINDGRTVRFTDEHDRLDSPPSVWGDTRIVYLQHGSDPVVFFSPTAFYREPEWLIGRRAPDVSSQVDWFPIVTGWQLLLDLPSAGSVPDGFGHMYSASANLEAWVGVTDPDGWTRADTAALGEHLDHRRQERKDLLEQLGE